MKRRLRALFAAQWRRGWVLAGILLLAAAVRFYRLDQTWFFLDHARDVEAATAIAGGSALPLLGPRIGSTGAHLGPLYFYLLAIPFSFSGDPLAGVVFVALVQVAAVLALYRFAAEFWCPRVAAYAAALFAVFPLCLFSGRLVWHVGLLPLLIVLFMHALGRLVVRERSAAVVPLGALLAMLIQLHLTAAALAVVALVAVLAYRPRLQRRHVVAAATLFVLLSLPLLLHEVASGLANTRALLTAASGQGLGGPRRWLRPTANLLRLFSPALDGFIDARDWSASFLAVFRTLYRIEALLMVCGLALSLWRMRVVWHRSDPGAVAERRRIGLLFLWVAIPPLLLAGIRAPAWWYYLDVVQPAPFILAAIALASPTRMLRHAAIRSRRTAAGFAAVLVLAVVLAQGAFDLQFQRLVAERGELSVSVPSLPINGATSPFETLVTLSLGERRAIVDALVHDLGVRPDGFGSAVHGAALGLAPYNRALVAWSSHRRGGRDHPPDGTHYLVAEASGPEVAQSDRRQLIGKHAIVAYRPAIDYASWRCAVTLARSEAEPRSIPIAIPTSNADLAVGPNEHLVCRGQLRARTGLTHATLAISAIGWGPFDAVALSIDGRGSSPTAEQRRQEALMLETAAGWAMGVGWASETIFDVPGLSAGENEITVELTGSGRLIGFDIYEGRSW